MAGTDSISPPGYGYSSRFKIASAFSGCFTFLVLLGPGMIVVADDPLGTAEARCITAFCIIGYLFLQLSCASHQRQHPETARARIYFWLLALFPFWSIPVALLAIGAIADVMNRLL